ncbi:class I SAM-dependent methyltransferase [Flammeovirga kamogawensis]|uniref:Class I SAM-dependent methyltransferase n=1 Tax=Flammeovirga kamogawensis TaxID=373891 RepID=A0ABX8H3S5_9BACT|nr:class I SAM-dependent methyltransferase [Flammeovirga kamogawensis]MBB6461938.1 2-polyprenyl-3-methyl-5-hydroxy-6-metoxy-1,4-benzoquinol methylase [Flammeovirga kamogawensis]QWG10455.1 class I SAM-dependent methyltransferase [Flammeovirga kamogawensis]TRX63566.1 class I SAM-dependent methyltransferase [Flammeovirga kamogawensis]
MNNQEINQKNKEIWNANAENWDSYMGEMGNRWHNDLIAPQSVELLKLKAGDKLLDIGCGNGIFARRMAKLDIHVTAFDFAETNINKAKNYDCTNIDYKVIDATKELELLSLGEGNYQAAVAHMTLMDMPTLDTLFASLSKLLINNGVFVFSIQHPVFNSNSVSEDENNNLILSEYIQKENYMGMAIPGQEHEQYYFHRPLSTYFEVAFKNGFVIDGYMEPTFSKEQDAFYSKFPPVLLVRLRRL